MATSGNPVLDELDQLSPQAKNALTLAHTQAQPSVPPPPDVPASQLTTRPMVAPLGGTPQSSSQAPTPFAPQGPKPLGPPSTPQPTAHQAEFARLAAPPLPSGNPEQHTKADTGVSGIDQIHNSLGRNTLKALDAFGSAFFPGLDAALPGTQLHHEQLVRDAGKNVTEDQTVENAQAKNKETASLGDEAEARADALKNPQDEFTPLATSTGDFAVSRKHGTAEPLTNNGEQLQPVEKPEKYTYQQTDQGLMRIDAGTGEATPVSFNGQPLKGKPEKQSVEEKAVADWMSKNPGKNEMDAYQALHPKEPKEPKDYGVTVVGPDGTVQHIEPGQRVPSGAVTPSAASSLNVPTAATRTMAETAPKVIDLATRVGQLVDEQEKTLGPAASRWNEFMSGKVGAPNPEFTKLRTDVGLLQTALMRMHVGARGGEQMMEHFQNLIDSSKQSPENMRAALGEITDYAKQVQDEGKSKGSQAPEGGGGGDMIKVQIPGQAAGEIHASQKAAFLKKYPNAKVIQ